MYGAILGDIIGSPYEFVRGPKSKDFPLFIPRSRYTDDSMMTVAVAEALLDSLGKGRSDFRNAVIHSMQKWGRRYPDAGYGAKFYYWLYEQTPEPYNSWGNVDDMVHGQKQGRIGMFNDITAVYAFTCVQLLILRHIFS